ncbi:MAG TPA: hypothetical protein VIQ99_07720 [Gammaproteobacteria bacterium]
MFTSTIILKGSVVVEGVSFSWWVRDGWEPMLTVSNHNHGTATRPLGTAEPVVQARAIAKSMIGRTHSRT